MNPSRKNLSQNTNAEACFEVFSECKNQRSDEGAEQDYKRLSFPPQRITEQTKEAKVNPSRKNLSQNANTQACFEVFTECKNQYSDLGAVQDFKSLSFPTSRITGPTKEAKVNPSRENLSQNTNTQACFEIFSAGAIERSDEPRSFKTILQQAERGIPIGAFQSQLPDVAKGDFQTKLRNYHTRLMLKNQDRRQLFATLAVIWLLETNRTFIRIFYCSPRPESPGICIDLRLG